MGLFFGFHMPRYTYAGVPDDELFDHVVGQARAAEAAGFDMITVMDHFYQIGAHGTEEEPMLEAYTTLGALAASTDHVLLGTMVTGVTYRNPALLAKIVTTLDVISKGRAVLGLGAAWNEDEHADYGFEFPPIGRRLDRLEEALQVCKAMFTEERPSFRGTFYSIDRALNHPHPIQPGGPRILVGGGGERRTLRIAAKYADMTNWFGTIEEASAKLAVLDRHCEEVGRDPASILRTITVGIVPIATEADRAATEARFPRRGQVSVTVATVPEAVDLLGRYVTAGFGGFILRNAVLRTPESIGLAGEMIRQVRGTPVAAGAR